MRFKTFGIILTITFAWVLWQKTDRVVSEVQTWEVVDGYETKKACDNTRLVMVKDGLKDGDKKIGTYSIQPGSKRGVVIIDYVCLPATNIDPRKNKEGSPVSPIPNM